MSSCFTPSVSKFTAMTQPRITFSKVTTEATRTRCEICSMLTIKTPERRQWRIPAGIAMNDVWLHFGVK